MIGPPQHGMRPDHKNAAQPGEFDVSPRFRCVALDLPGHGDSAKPESISIEMMGTAVNRVKDRIAAPSTILVGHSMGCRVIIEAFQQSGATVSGFVFVDGSILGCDLQSTMKSTKAAIAIALEWMRSHNGSSATCSRSARATYRACSRPECLLP
jgi:pimeloyl-ACP methyl ester carboxylesterase